MFFSDVPLSIFALLMLPSLINLWGISHAIRHNFPKENERSLWMAACIFLPILGGILYLIFGLRRSQPTNINTDNTKDSNTDEYNVHEYINNNNNKNGE